MLRVTKKTYGFDDLLLMPRFSTIESRSHVDLSVDLKGIRLSSPIISSNMDTITEHEMAISIERMGGLGIIHRYLSENERLEQLQKTTDLKYRALAVGVTAEEIRIAKLLIENGANIICLDVAHGHSSLMERALKELHEFSAGVSASKSLPLERVIFIAGNVATPEGAKDLALWGADCLKVGIGPGSMCTTRVVTGAGYGQLSAIADCAYAVSGACIIADGGIRNSGDATKALAAGADAVMMGRVLAGTHEVPAWARESGTYRGMASAEAQGSFYGYTFNNRHPEGVATRVPSRGPISDVLGPFLGGVRSGLSYVGARNITELRKFAEFVECAPGVVAESLPHGLMPDYGRELKRS